MSLGDFVQKNQKVAAFAAVVILVIAVLAIGRQIARKPQRPSTFADQVYLYDLATGELTVGPGDTAGITANVFACNSCDDDTDRAVAYITRITDEARAELAKPLPDPSIMMEGQQIALPSKDPKWVPQNSDAGMQIQASAQRRCAQPIPCAP